MAAAVDAAADLLAEQGPHTLTVRQIAERAGVNHALLHRHFGTKDEIVRQALAARSAALAQDIRDTATEAGDTPHGSALSVAHVLDVLAQHPAYWTTLARVALDTPELAGRGTAPTTQLFAAALEEQGADPGRVAAAACLMLGWQVFGDFVVEVTGTSSEALDQHATTLLRTLLRPGGTPPYD